MGSKHRDVNALGVIGLVVGLCLVAPGARIMGRDATYAVLGWVLIAMSGLLVLTSVLTVPVAADQDSDPGTGAAADPSLLRPYQHPSYPLPVSQTGADAPS